MEEQEVRPGTFSPKLPTCAQPRVEIFPVERRASDPDLPLAVHAARGVIPMPIATEMRLPKERSRNTNARSRRCASCRTQRKKCEQLADTDDPRCVHCLKHDLPSTLCVREVIWERKPFEKWKNSVYEALFTVAQHTGNDKRSAHLGHYAKGPRLEVLCCDFEPTYKHQTRALKKDSAGWHSLITTAFCLGGGKVDIASYIDDCIPFVLNEVCESQSLASVFFRIVRVYQDTPLIRECLRLFTCIRLLFIGWQLCGHETLDMALVHDPQSPWNGTTPVPRMIQNQLGHLLELQMSAIDQRILKTLHSIVFETRSRTTWVFTTLAFFILLHVRELDAARNIYWSRYKDTGGFWIHPSKPNSLIDEELASCGALLAHYHSVVGNAPMTINWDHPGSKELLGDNEMAITTIKVLQSYVASLRDKGSIGRKASEVYRPGDPDSMELTISWKVFDSKRTGCEVGDFC
ncbi:hypothetical protein N7523_005721 [Penicillium sp. IBT 18751x]|nr:hypothetical protein N7523_005721 [Penicillium sp. IBT 18751x]